MFNRNFGLRGTMLICAQLKSALETPAKSLRLFETKNISLRCKHLCLGFLDWAKFLEKNDNKLLFNKLLNCKKSF